MVMVDTWTLVQQRSMSKSQHLADNKEAWTEHVTTTCRGGRHAIACLLTVRFHVGPPVRSSRDVHLHLHTTPRQI
jgi:hypothetical protein